MEGLKDIIRYMRARKTYWLAPIIFILVLVGILIVLGGSSAVGPFIYSLF